MYMIQGDLMRFSNLKSKKEIRLLKRSRTHTRTARRDQDAGCIYVQIRERYQMHEYYQTAAGFFYYRYDGSYYGSSFI